MENRLTFTLNGNGTSSLAALEREAASIVAYVRENRLMRSQCQVPLSLSQEVGKQIAEETKRREFDKGVNYAVAQSRVAADYPACFALANYLRCTDGDPHALCDVTVLP